jgi:hypothetical protein
MAKQINMAEEARSIGIDPQRIYNRMNRGDTFAQAVQHEMLRKIPRDAEEHAQARDNAVKALIETENEVDALEGKLEFAAKRCKTVAFCAAIIIAVLAWMAFGNGRFY